MLSKLDLDGWIGEVAERHGVPGIAVAVGHRGELAEAAAGVVNVDTGVPTTPDTVFQIGSVTKVWTAALRERLLDPLGARQVALLPEEAILFRASAGHWKGEVIRPWSS
ncbi:serine hydrolase [Actinoplanes sp. CA-054009]